jgi:hypothetical protein
MDFEKHLILISHLSNLIVLVKTSYLEVSERIVCVR